MQRDPEQPDPRLVDVCRRCVGALQVLVALFLIIAVVWLIALMTGCRTSGGDRVDRLRSISHGWPMNRLGPIVVCAVLLACNGDDPDPHPLCVDAAPHSRDLFDPCGDDLECKSGFICDVALYCTFECDEDADCPTIDDGRMVCYSDACRFPCSVPLPQVLDAEIAICEDGDPPYWGYDFNMCFSGS